MVVTRLGMKPDDEGDDNENKAIKPKTQSSEIQTKQILIVVGIAISSMLMS